MASQQMGPVGATAPTAAGVPDNATQARAYQLTAATGFTQNLQYLDEDYYFVRQEVALHLSEAGEYEAALAWFRQIYDYTRPPAARRVAQKLVVNGAASPDFVRVAGWLQDPLDPHAIAETRRDAYTRFTLLALVNCLLAFADSEYTRGTTESVPRAIRLYLQALALLDVPELTDGTPSCDDLIGTLLLQAGSDEVIWGWRDLQLRLPNVRDAATLAKTVTALRPLLTGDGDPVERLAAARQIVDALPREAPAPATVGALLDANAKTEHAVFTAMSANAALAATLEALTAGTSPPPPRRVPLAARRDLPPWDRRGPIDFVPAPKLWACIPPNPDLAALRRRAQLNLEKIRQCRNIAGLAWEPAPEPVSADAGVDALTSDPLMQSATTRQPFPPVPYRYSTLIERAKQLADRAAHFEQAMLSALQSADAERYEELKARQDLELSAAAVRVKDIQVTQANDSMDAARLQRERARLQEDHYDTLLSAGMSENETAAMFLNAISAGISGTQSGGDAAGIGAAAGMGGVLFSTYASQERRQQDWFLALEVSRQDVSIGDDQVRITEDAIAAATQERAIAELKANQAATVVQFLATKQFGSAALYEWMANVQEDVYRFFLQAGASTALVAQAMLAFERQEPVPSFIRSDYWRRLESGDAAATSGLPADTRGLTGSARLLQDIYELDQYAFQTNQRKLQLTETLSLAELDPLAFARFQQTGVLRFSTPMRLFDARFPGHYLRLIRRVRASIIASIPPGRGVRATLASTGSSRVVVGPDRFQAVRVQREPEQIAFTAPRDATGVSDLDASGELRLPFEGMGLDASWELRVARPANLFDYRTIADVLLTIDYSALDSPTYRKDVIRSLDRSVSSDRPFSFRQQFADAWYDLLNPDQATPPPMTVTFHTRVDDFPANLSDLTIRALALYFARPEGGAAALPTARLRFTPAGGATIDLGQAAADSDGVISTRRGRWAAILAPPRLPVGTWELAFPDNAATRQAFGGGGIEDLLLVVTFGARTAAWPA